MWQEFFLDIFSHQLLMGEWTGVCTVSFTKL